MCYLRKFEEKYRKNHKWIHSAQKKELGTIRFYVTYVFEFLYRLIFHTKSAYRGIRFEKEAYDHMFDLDYSIKRDPFKWREDIYKD